MRGSTIMTIQYDTFAVLAKRAAARDSPARHSLNAPALLSNLVVEEADMKKIVCAALAALIAVSAFGQTKKLPDLKGRTVRAVTENAFTPLNFVDPKTGKAMGWEYDAVNEIARRLNAKLVWNICSWDTMIQAVRDGQYDVGMDGISITDDRRKQVEFSDPYMVSQQFMLVRKDEARFKNAAEFAANPKLLIGSQAGTTNFYVAVYNVLDGKEDNPRIKLLETFGATVQALLSGDVDCVLMDAASSRGYVGANPEKLKVVGEPLGTDNYGFIFKLGSDLVVSFNAAIKAMKDDGTLDKLTTKWFYEYSAR
jgi:polar amino acid transport system substrate-binding protein